MDDQEDEEARFNLACFHKDQGMALVLMDLEPCQACIDGEGTCPPCREEYDQWEAGRSGDRSTPLSNWTLHRTPGGLNITGFDEGESLMDGGVIAFQEEGGIVTAITDRGRAYKLVGPRRSDRD